MGFIDLENRYRWHIKTEKIERLVNFVFFNLVSWCGICFTLLANSSRLYLILQVNQLPISLIECLI